MVALCINFTTPASNSCKPESAFAKRDQLLYSFVNLMRLNLLFRVYQAEQIAYVFLFHVSKLSKYN